MGQRDAELHRGQSTSKRGTCIAIDKGPIRLFAQKDLFNANHHLSGLAGMRSDPMAKFTASSGIASSSKNTCDISRS
jgi:hypothetical protein